MSNGANRCQTADFRQTAPEIDVRHLRSRGHIIDQSVEEISMPAGKSKNFGKGVVYGITIVPLLVTLAYYFLEHVPTREEYFLNLRFRTLSVIGKQIETKLGAV